jgi:hypothetical protein
MLTTTCQSNLDKESKPDNACGLRLKDEQGIAMILVMIALSLVTAFGAYLFLSSVEELRISDNSESMLQARFAARAGIDHAREVFRGRTFNAALVGPDGTYSNDSTYLATARTYTFRNLLGWNVLRSLSIEDPTSDVISLPDDGLINTGYISGTAGTVLIPQTGVVLTATNPYAGGTLTTARYFIKVTDNNGETSELAKDSLNNPFIDGDGTIIVRSIGVAKAIAEGSGSGTRRNSVAIFESRFRQGTPFSNLGSPAIVIGSDIAANFSGNAFSILGNGDGPGIATIDTDLTDGYHPDEILSDATDGKGTISGNCPSPNQNHCIADITGSVINDPNKSMLRDPVWLYDFVNNKVPTMADNTITDGRVGSVDLGTTSNPKVTFVNGDLDATGGITGAGLLVVTGELSMGGSITFDGLVLVVGQGSFWAHGMNRGIHGGLIVANLILNDAGVPVFGRSSATVDFDIRGNSDITTYDGALANMGNGLMPLEQLSFREIKNGMDP